MSIENCSSASFSYDSLLKKDASFSEKIQFWVARKVVVEKSWFWSKISAIFGEKSLFNTVKPILEECKRKLEEKKATLIKLAAVTEASADPKNIANPPGNSSEPQPPVLSAANSHPEPKEASGPEITAAAIDQGGNTPASIVNKTQPANASTSSEIEASKEQDISSACQDEQIQSTTHAGASDPFAQSLFQTCLKIDTLVKTQMLGEVQRPVLTSEDPFFPLKSLWKAGSSLIRETEIDPSLAAKQQLQMAIEGAKDKDMQTDLHETFAGDSNMQTLINQPLPNLDLPLHYAVFEGKFDAVKFLLEHGADPLQLNYQNQSALDYAVLVCKSAKDENVLKEYGAIKQLMAAHYTNKLIDLLNEGMKKAALQNVPKEQLIEYAFKDPDFIEAFNKLALSQKMPLFDTQNVNSEQARQFYVNLALMGLSLCSWTPENSYLAFAMLLLNNMALTSKTAQDILGAIKNREMQQLGGAAWGILGTFAYPIPYVRQFMSALNTAAFASSTLSQIGNFSLQDFKNRPGALLRKTLVTSVNAMSVLRGWVYHPAEVRDLRNKERDNAMVNLTPQMRTMEDRGALSTFLYDPKACNPMYDYLSTKYVNLSEQLNMLKAEWCPFDPKYDTFKQELLANGSAMYNTTIAG